MRRRHRSRRRDTHEVQRVLPVRVSVSRGELISVITLLRTRLPSLTACCIESELLLLVCRALYFFSRSGLSSICSAAYFVLGQTKTALPSAAANLRGPISTLGVCI
jgi:hypothetical protein